MKMYQGMLQIWLIFVSETPQMGSQPDCDMSASTDEVAVIQLDS